MRGTVTESKDWAVLSVGWKRPTRIQNFVCVDKLTKIVYRLFRVGRDGEWLDWSSLARTSLRLGTNLGWPLKFLNQKSHNDQDKQWPRKIVSSSTSSCLTLYSASYICKWLLLVQLCKDSKMLRDFQIYTIKGFQA